MKYLKLIASLLFIIFLWSCSNENGPSSSDNQDGFSENFGIEINRTFLGRVIDVNENPIEGVNIAIGSSTAVTNNAGVFIIRDAQVNERFAYVKAEKFGYINGSRAVVPTSGTNNVAIMLLEATIVGTTSSGIAETISLSNGASVALEGNYVKGDGTSYAGDVNVIMHHLDPTDDNMINQMPGMLYAENSEGDERMLQTFGMLAIELRGSSGEALNLVENSTAEINVPLDASLLANAPTTIPLWYFDEEVGYWKEDGLATLVDNAYVGTVTHFSFWNCDIPAEAVHYCVKVIDENGNPISNLDVEITSSEYGSSNGITNENGEVCGYVPVNELLELNIYPNNPYCESLYTSTIGPFSEDSSFTISLDLFSIPNLISENIIGTLYACEGNLVETGYIELNYNGIQINGLVSNGNFSINFIRCDDDNNTFYVQGYDYVILQDTNLMSYTFNSPITNIGDVVACSDASEFITYQIDDQDPVIYTDTTTFYSELGGSSFRVIHPHLNNGPWFYIRLGDNQTAGFSGVGDYHNSSSGGDSLVFIIENDINGNTLSTTGNDGANIGATISVYGAVGEFVDINFSGIIPDANGIIHDITGSIHVLRGPDN